MKVIDITVTALSIPLARPFNGVPPARRVSPLVVQLRTEEGLEGMGLAFTFNDQRVGSLKASIDDLSDLVIGQDVFRWAGTWQRLWDETKWMGHQGHSIYALSAFDTALWDLRAKAMELPLAHLLGGYREEVPAYASHLLFRDWTLDELQKDAALLVEQGFKVVKMNLGDKPAGKEIERVRVVREAVGEDVGIMVDVNWSWTVPQAIQMGRELERHNVYWLEDPVASGDPDDLAEIARALAMPVAAGETLSGKYAFRPLLEKRSVDTLIVDLQRVGGVTEWMRVATMAQAWNLPVASHVFHDISAHLVAAIPNGRIVEYMPLWDVIYQEPPEVKDGHIRISDKPGIGLELDRQAVKHYEVR